MFLVSEDQYKSKTVTATAGSTTAADVLGDIQESQVNNIETHGGTVVIGSGGGRIPNGGGYNRNINSLNVPRVKRKNSRDKPSVDNGPSYSSDGVDSSNSRRHFSPSEPPSPHYYVSNGGLPSSSSSTTTGRRTASAAQTVAVTSGPRTIVSAKRSLPQIDQSQSETRKLAIAKRTLRGAQSPAALRSRLDAANTSPEIDQPSQSRPTAVARRRSANASLRRQALKKSTAVRIAAEDDALDESLRQRLDVLLGRSSSPAVERGPPLQAAEAVNSAQEQAVLHDLRTVHRREKRPRSVPRRSVPRSNPRPSLRKGHPGRAKRSRAQEDEEEEEDREPPLPFPPFRYLSEDEDDELQRAAAGVTTSTPAPRSLRTVARGRVTRRPRRNLTSADRREVDNEIENLRLLHELNELESMQHLPNSAFETGGKKRKAGNQGGTKPQYRCVPIVDPPEGRKRKRPAWEDLSRERRWQETLTEIPYKSKLITYDDD